MLKVKDLKKLLEDLPDESDVVLEDDDGQIYDCYSDVQFHVDSILPLLVIAKE